MKSKFILLAALAAATSASYAQSDLRVTEVMYTGLYGEFFEITNVAADEVSGANDQDVEGYFFVDSDTGAAPTYFPAVTLAPGESIVFTEADPQIFNLAWYVLPSANPTQPNPPASLKAVVANVTRNLGRTDAINISDGSPNFFETLNFTDQANQSAWPVGHAKRGDDVGVRTEEKSAVPGVVPGVTIPSNTFKNWVFSDNSPVGAAQEWQSGNPAGNGSIGNPGIYIR